MTALLLAAGYVNADVTATVARVPGFGERATALSVSRTCGGMTANAACAAARLGLRTQFFGQVGEDPDGDSALAELQRFGVGTRWVVRSPLPTSTALVLLSPDGERAIISEPMRFDYDPLEEAVKSHAGEENACVHVDGYRLPEALELLRWARELGFRTSADLDGFETEELAGSAKEIATALDAVVLNGRLMSVLAASPGAAARHLLRLGAKVVAVTLGGKGAVVVWEGGAVSVRPPRVMVRDVTGAGDAFVGAFLADWLEGRRVEQAARLAVAAGAISVGGSGARGRLPGRQEAEQFARMVTVGREDIENGSEAG